MNKTTLEKIASTPAELLEEGIEGVHKSEKKLISKRPFRVAQEYLNTLGPGLITGAADDDPSGIATYSQTGAQYGFQFLWLSLITFPLMAIVQEMCARIGLVTGVGLAANIRKHYSPPLLYICTGLLVAANVFNISADLGAMASSTKLLLPSLSVFVLIFIFAISMLLLQIFSTYARYAKYLKYLSLVLVTYIITAFVTHFNWHGVLIGTFIPHIHFSRNELILVCAILGTTISPYLFFWQTSQEVEEEILKGNDTVKERTIIPHDRDIKRMRTDVWSGMFVSNLVMFFIIVTCGAVLFTHGVTTITTAAQAAKALQPLAGNFAATLFTIGIVGTGMLAIPVLAGSSAYAVSESFGWKFGLYRKLKGAYAFYGIIIISMILGIGLNFIGLDPIKALIYSAVFNGIISPLVIAIIIHLSSSQEIMGKWRNSALIKNIGWGVTVLMLFSAGAAIFALFF